MAVELHLGLAILVRQAEMAEEIFGLLAPGPQVVDQRLGMHLLLKVDRRRVDGQLGLIRILPTPDELRIEIAVAPLIGHLDCLSIRGFHDRFEFGRGNVRAGFVVGDRANRLFVVHFVASGILANASRYAFRVVSNHSIRASC